MHPYKTVSGEPKHEKLISLYVFFFLETHFTQIGHFNLKQSTPPWAKDSILHQGLYPLDIFMLNIKVLCLTLLPYCIKESLKFRKFLSSDEIFYA